MVYSIWINCKNTPINQILNSKEGDARETLRTFENFTGKTCYDGLAGLDLETGQLSRHCMYTAKISLNIKREFY